MEIWLEQLNDEHIDEIHALMTQEWWCSDRTIDEVRKVITGSDITLAALDHEQKVAAFARALTDGVFKAIIYDVIVRADCRNTRLGERLIEQLKQHPTLKNVKNLELYCPDHISGFYKKLGFKVSDSKLHRYCIS